MNWADLFSSMEYDFPLDVGPGSTFAVGDGFPDAVVRSAQVAPAKAILVQRVELEATDHDARTETLMVYRVLAVNELGEMVEIRRQAVPLEPGHVDISRCAGCGGAIPDEQAVVIAGQAYHKRCVDDDEEKQDARTAGAGSGVPVLRVPLRTGQHRGEGQEGKAKQAVRVASKAALEAVTVTYSDNGISPSHCVTVTRLDDDDDLVTLWAREFGGRSGTVRGRWPNGLFPTAIPRNCDVAYINEKFFLGSTCATATDVSLWEGLYAEALSMMGGAGMRLRLEE